MLVASARQFGDCTCVGPYPTLVRLPKREDRRDDCILDRGLRQATTGYANDGQRTEECAGGARRAYRTARRLRPGDLGKDANDRLYR